MWRNILQYLLRALGAPPLSESIPEVVYRPTNYDDVMFFHRHFRLLNYTVPGHLTQRKLQERIDFMQEELDEFVQASSKQDIVEQADALIDLVYVALGTACMMGLPWQELWTVVHEANMRKERRAALTGNHHDVIKPSGWVAPEAQLAEVLRIAGYRQHLWCEINELTGGDRPIEESLCRDDLYYHQKGN